MKQAQLTSLDAAKIGLWVSSGFALLALIFVPDTRNYTIFGLNAVLVVFLFGITGALSGRLLSPTPTAAWLGAVITLLLLIWWLYRIASTAVLD